MSIHRLPGFGPISKARPRGTRALAQKPVTHSRAQSDMTNCVCGHSAYVHAANAARIADAEWPCRYDDCTCKNWTQNRKEYNVTKGPRPVAAPKHGTQDRTAQCKHCGSRIKWNNLDRNWYHSATTEKRCGK